jgi:hypothetical protein
MKKKLLLLLLISTKINYSNKNSPHETLGEQKQMIEIIRKPAEKAGKETTKRLTKNNKQSEHIYIINNNYTPQKELFSLNKNENIERLINFIEYMEKIEQTENKADNLKSYLKEAIEFEEATFNKTVEQCQHQDNVGTLGICEYKKTHHSEQYQNLQIEGIKKFIKENNLFINKIKENLEVIKNAAENIQNKKREEKENRFFITKWQENHPVATKIINVLISATITSWLIIQPLPKYFKAIEELKLPLCFNNLMLHMIYLIFNGIRQSPAKENTNEVELNYETFEPADNSTQSRITTGDIILSAKATKALINEYSPDKKEVIKE